MDTIYLSLSRFVWAKVITSIFSKLNSPNIFVDTNHNGYTFIRSADAINFRPRSTVGLYRGQKGKEFYIKDYGYKIHDLDYEYLCNEINILKTLSSIKMPDLKVGLVELQEAIDENKRLTIVTKLCKGERLDKFSKKIIIQVLFNTISYFRNISDFKSNIELKKLPKRSRILSYTTFPVYFLRSIIKEPGRSVLFIKALKLYYMNLPSLIAKPYKYCLCHRDLLPSNIIYNQNTGRSTIIDLECGVIDSDLLDLAMLPRLYVNILDDKDFVSIIKKFNFDDHIKNQLKALMIATCFIKIATEKENTRDYNNAIKGLSLIVNKIIPQLSN